jgi:glycosyltransferase involved in cell wall biosynthesis
LPIKILKKVLFIAPCFSNEVTGGSLGSQINYQILSECNIQLYTYFINIERSLLKKIISVIKGYKNGLNRPHIKKILELIGGEDINVVFSDTCLYGILLENIKKKYKEKIVMCFFHNCEYKLYGDYCKNRNIFFRYLLMRSVRINESKALYYSTIAIFLNSRDVKECQKIYPVDNKNIVYSPIALNDVYVPFINSDVNSASEPCVLLFVGSYFSPNINGLLWFDKNVLPYIDYKLIIVGKNFDNKEFVSRLINKEKIIIRGFVDDLNTEYRNADIVVQPIFEGAGMKTKTAEAFMHGKAIISTSEGLVGYDVKNKKNVYRCDTSDEFISRLNDLKNKKIFRYNTELRDLYVNNYSKYARAKVYANLIERID